MVKKLLIILAIFLLSGSAMAGEYKSESYTKTSCLLDDSSDYADLKNYNAFGVEFKLMQVDTLKSDSINVLLQTSWDEKVTWETIREVARLDGADTATCYKFFTTDSLIHYSVGRYVRLLVITHYFATADTSTYEIIRPTGDGTTHDWVKSTGSTFYGVLDESTLDTTDYDSSYAYNKWLVVTCGPHTMQERAIDSIKVTTRGGWEVDTTYFKFGATLADTATALRLLSDTTMMKEIDSTTYAKVFATNPYGTKWTIPQVDSLGVILQSRTVNTGGVLHVAQAYITIYYEKGIFSPPIIWRARWSLKQKDPFGF
jgi:hypothetical protein